MPMNAEIKRQWIADLRSGEFTQGRTYLHQSDKMCCLGVLCHRAAEAGKVSTTTSNLGVVRYGSSESLLPGEVVAWAEISERADNPNTDGFLDGHAYVKVDKDLVALVELNDNLGWTFAQIADALETDPDI